MSTFVMVHGGGHGGWCWKPTAQLLRRRGHEVHTPTLTGFGERCHLDVSQVTFETFVEDIANVLYFEDLTDVILVGHSMGGCIIPRVAQRVPDRIRRVIWLAAVVNVDGESLLQAVPQNEWTARAVTLGEDGTAHTDEELILDANIHDGTPEQKQFVREYQRPYPPHALVEPGRLSEFLALGIPTGYILTLDDRTILPEVQRKFPGRLSGCQYAEVPGGHDCMITQPEAVADTLEAMGS